MKLTTWLGIVAVVCLAGSTGSPSDPPANKADGKPSEPKRPQIPPGQFSDRLGQYLTIEGKYQEGTWVTDNILSVEVVNGKKLDKPLGIQIEGVKLPKEGRCVLKGYESGRMIGRPPAERDAAYDLGLEYKGRGQAVWHWQPYFVPLIAVEPKDLKIEKSDK